MTDREKAIVMAHTGICMLEGEKLGVFYQYLNELYGRPVYTHEWVTLDIKEKSKPDFLQLCKEEEPDGWTVSRMDNHTISRQAAIDALEKRTHLTWEHLKIIYPMLDVLEELPSAERRGRWEFNIDDNRWSWDNPYMCDQCGEWAEKAFKFCPNCGARMEDAEE